MKTFPVNNQNMGPVHARRHRQFLIELRDIALERGSFDYALVLSEIIALQFQMSSEIWGKEWFHVQ